MKLILAFLTLTILLFQDCDGCKPDGDCLQSFHFQVPISISPQIDTIHIGDTFCLNSRIPDFLRDTFSSQDVDVSQFEFDLTNDIVRHTDTGYVSAEMEFDFINKKGEYLIIPIAANVVRSLVRYEKIGNEKVFESCFVPKRTGLYELAFYHLSYENRKVVDTECYQSIEIDVEINTGEDNNYGLLQSSPQAIASEEVYKRWGGFTLLVVE